jgi:glycosyltransferase involved in cell wall biosynthesis
MKVSAFTFLRNAEKFGYPFVQSIRSILPIVDEFVIALGPSDDETEKLLRAVNDPKIRIIPTVWNENMRGDYSVKGFVYGQQKSIALFNCTGDWAFYLEGDEVVHEEDLPKIRSAMERYLEDDRVEALAFDYVHFYGNANTYVWSPRWYRSEVRILRNTIPGWGPKGLYFVVLDTPKKGRYPRAAHTTATIYHYGWVKTEAEINARKQNVAKFWSKKPMARTIYAEIDPITLRAFRGTHPKVVQDWLEPAQGLFQTNQNHQLSFREKKHRVMLKIEQWFGVKFNPKHYKLVR